LVLIMVVPDARREVWPVAAPRAAHPLSQIRDAKPKNIFIRPFSSRNDICILYRHVGTGFRTRERPQTALMNNV
jgi:hypothetical protein